ncbi:MAG: vanadium-dependent haloperoxidase [Actinomycetota bacterium]
MRAPLALLLAAALVLTSCVSSGDSSQVCTPEDGRSVARLWNEAALDAIRRDFPAPTVHARNLFHLSVAMWDTWAVFDPDATGYLFTPDAVLFDEAADRDAAIAFAAHTVLTERYAIAVGAEESLAAFDALLIELCLDPDEPDRFGVAVGERVLDASADDGSNEGDVYVADFEVVNQPMVFDEPGTTMVDPNRWQQLEFEIAMTQNGQLLESNVQDYVGPHWGFVTPFALAPDPVDGLPIDPGPPPLFDTPTQERFEDAAVDVVRASASLDPGDGVTIDIGPGARGDNPLGTDDGDGHDVNPATGEPYEPNVVLAGDFYRVVAEFWADGPDSETPPGHWNTLANQASDALAATGELRIGGTGDPVDRLEWDLTTYFALNGALHDAAIAAWGAKAHYDYARPISMIRYLAGVGRLPPEPGLVEPISAESSAPGERHAHLTDHVGEAAVWAWAPEPVFFGEELTPVRWILASEWIPYQRRTFVTPAFPGYVSGHSTFSRAAAEVLTELTGSPFFPGGIGTHIVEELEFEDGPTEPVELQWATYRDAADEAGRSRIYGGIHVEADDLAGRTMGAEVGRNAWALAVTYLG